ncbi:HAMP domain-containing histidine kinase [Aquibium carbonis]|uniref:histidine kinase n=1 Tax=Aquibium carbonis TaxID=2495581 RepID=A0A429YYQ6_9HYPH|nr:HAMP domain-containing sensor histidine kinase [Aquibium carbonis]RST86534.1 HAMP domain-containing histidine kinase [Aquibium carbonis]
MKPRSIRVRLLLLAVFGVLLALAIAGAGLVALFGRHVERRAAQELDNTIAVLAGNVAFSAQGDLAVAREPSDPAYRTPLSGRYWQVAEADGPPSLRSVSLWDAALDVASSPVEPGRSTIARSVAPDGQPLLVRETTVIIVDGGRDRRLRIAAAVATSEFDALKRGFALDLLPALAVFGLVILVGAWFQVRAGLAPLADVRGGLRRIRSGDAPLLPDRVPVEIAPLVAEINGLLIERAKEMEKARNRAADLAHGIKTPLTALASDTQRLRARGETDLADSVAATAASMQRVVERELTRARLRPETADGAPLRPVVEAIVRTLRLTPAGEALDYRIEVPGDLRSTADDNDLHDLFGNLMENAARAARTSVHVVARLEGAAVSVRVCDDGEGADPVTMRSLLARGARLDETGGAGLGLAIVSEILSAYGSELEFSVAAHGGLCVRFSLPPAPVVLSGR